MAYFVMCQEAVSRILGGNYSEFRRLRQGSTRAKRHKNEDGDLHGRISRENMASYL